MEKPRLEVVITSRESAVCRKRRVSALEDDQPVSKRLRVDLPIYTMEWEASLPPQRGLVASCRASPAVRPPSAQPQKKPARRVPYDPYDFTSDELDPAFEWPRESPPAWKRGAEVVLLQSMLGHFPLGLRLEKLVAMMWKLHQVHLGKLSVEKGYGDILRFLSEVPGVSVSKGGSHYLVRMV